MATVLSLMCQLDVNFSSFTDEIVEKDNQFVELVSVVKDV